MNLPVVLPATLTRSVGKLALTLNRYSPVLCLAGSAACGIAAGIEIYRATPKFKEIMEEHKKDIAEHKDMLRQMKDGTLKVDGYTKKDAAMDRISLYVKVLVKGIITFRKALGFGFAAFSLTVLGYRILNKRIIGISAALAAKTAQYNTLESNTREKYGDEVLEQLKRPKTKETIETHKDPETGETVVDKVTREQPEDYSRFFDEMNRNWKKNAAANLNFLEQVERWINIRLVRDGFVFLNDVYKELGYDPIFWSPAGQFVGWIHYKTPEEAAAHGADNYISFGLERPDAIAFKNGQERSVLLTFNVDEKPIIAEMERLNLIAKVA